MYVPVLFDLEIFFLLEYKIYGGDIAGAVFFYYIICNLDVWTFFFFFFFFLFFFFLARWLASAPADGWHWLLACFHNCDCVTSWLEDNSMFNYRKKPLQLMEFEKKMAPKCAKSEPISWFWQLDHSWTNPNALKSSRDD